MTVLSSKFKKARKEYKCMECFKKILKGERYLNETQVRDGTFFKIKLCSDCHRLWQDAFKLKLITHSDEVNLGDLREYLGEDIKKIVEKKH